MSALINLQNSLNWCRPFLKNQPLEVSNFEPALTTGNMVVQTMLGAPFRWPFNRSSFSLPLTANDFDYNKTVADFGFIENVSITDANSGETMPLSVELSLPKPPKQQQRPTGFAIQTNDGSGNLVIRLKERPMAAYTLEGVYQKAAPKIYSPATKWKPVTDDFAFIYNWGFLTITALMTDDARFTTFEKFFIARLLATQDGLDEQTKNIFLGNWMAMTRTAASSTNRERLGAGARGN